MDQQDTLPAYMIPDEGALDIENAPRAPHFPIIIFFVAILKDVTDIASVGLAGIITSLMFGMVLWIWMFHRPGYLKKNHIQFVMTRWGVAFLIGMVPALNFIPETAILVWLIHKREKKVVKDIRSNIKVE